MKEKRDVFVYFEQVLVNFGVSIVLMNLFCLIFGESAQPISTMFAFGRDGLSVETMMQFILLSIISVILRNLFFTDVLFKKMSQQVRIAGMMISLFLTISVFILLFDWFPADNIFCWLIFALCFVICIVISLWCTTIRERDENRRMEEALDKLKMEEKDE